MELVLPRNYVEIEQEEMMYLDGGFGVKLLMSFIRRNGSAAARKKFNNVLIRFVSTRVANTVTGLVLGAINGFLSFSVGAAVTTIWDRNDTKPNNGSLNALW